MVLEADKAVTPELFSA
jgi:hypothetical protein